MKIFIIICHSIKHYFFSIVKLYYALKNQDIEERNLLRNFKYFKL